MPYIHQMRIYIDEAGPFVVPQSGLSSFSLVLALILRSETESELFYEFLRLRDCWPKQAIEIKGSSLDERQTAEVIDLLVLYDPLVEFVALDMASHSRELVERFKLRQADAVTAHVTREHNAGVVHQLQILSETIRNMPNQLFLQAFAVMHLILDTIEQATLYFVQRSPKELGDIAWIVDRKDHAITEMEQMWTTLILPTSEHHFATSPLGTLQGADYSYFDARYGIKPASIDPEMVRHIEWMSKTYSRPAKEERFGVDANLLLTEQRSLLDSRDSLGLQLADIAASTVRRALNGRLQFSGWKDFGKLLVRRRELGSFFIQLGAGDPIRLSGHPAQVCRILDSQAKSMLTEMS